ncbi:dihydroxyacetone kinase subunit DhaK [Blautia schinkii]|nr:dihydroxyacetone kinase subunit DhaK [Blautia schinkii]
MKLLNSTETALDDMLKGLMLAQPGEFRRIEDEYSYALVRQSLRFGKVQVMVNGGGGWGPLFPGVVGEGLADAMVHGDFNCAPNAWLIYQAAREIEDGKGVFILTNNYAGDYLNNDMAQELLNHENIPSYVCYVSDNVCSARGEGKDKRGGMTGIGLLLKLASALSQEGAELEEITRVVEKANDRLRTIAVCCSEDGDVVEYGNGFSGEPPAFREKYRSADASAQRILDFLLPELEDFRGDSLFLMVNRMKKMSYLEGYVMLNALSGELARRGYSLGGCAVGGYFDAFDTNGCIVSVMACDQELKSCLKPVKGYDFTL